LVHPDAEQLQWLDPEPGFLEELSMKGIERMLRLEHVPAGKIPEPLERLGGTADEEQATA
jgi:hypothetical protein